MTANYCLKCGAKNNLDANFCYKCGYKFKSDNSTVTEKVIPKKVKAEKVQETQENEEDEEEGQGESLQECPEITQASLIIEEIETDKVKGITLVDLIKEAEINKRNKK